MDVFAEIKERLNIKEVIRFYGVRVGRNNTFCCPFHNDKKPSASIKNDYFNCFVCGTGGDCITFVSKMFGLSNIDACKKLNQDFNLGLYFGREKDIKPINKLRAERERRKRETEKKEREQIEKLIAHTGAVLADYHCYLWQGVHLYPITDKRHVRGLQRLTEAQYYLECYDSNPREYSLKNRKGVATIEKRLHRWNHENERI